MKNSLLVTCLVAVAAAVTGIGISAKLNNDAVILKVVEQQQQMFDLQKRILAQLQEGPGAGKADALAAATERMTATEQKLDSLLAKVMPSNQERVGPPPEDYDTVHEIPLGVSPVKGSDKAPVTITGFLDLQCPFSARFQPAIDQVLADYKGKVNYMVKHFPLGFHQQARPAAKAVLAAGEQGKYWEMLEAILKDNRDLNEEKLTNLAKSLKLNMKKYEAALKDNDAKWEKQITEELELGVKVEVRGTPSYYINGKKTRARTPDDMKKEIDEILKQK
jgi:protein-disulfide isomerase